MFYHCATILILLSETRLGVSQTDLALQENVTLGVKSSMDKHSSLPYQTQGI